MLACFRIDLTGEGFPDGAEEVDFAQKVVDLLFTLKARKCLSNSALLAGGVVSEHVVKMPAILTPCFDLEVE